MANKKRPSIIYVTRSSIKDSWYEGLIGKTVYIWENEEKPDVYWCFDDGYIALFIPKCDAQVIQ